ncbi:unannotated protein [freshwater metagenome]|uniref:Unannotated protein n=1 Tax=freshwater metagenome TaxID=449393 RepID=A0A6J6WIS3_9ZZZZ
MAKAHLTDLREKSVLANLSCNEVGPDVGRLAKHFGGAQIQDSMMFRIVEEARTYARRIWHSEPSGWTNRTRLEGGRERNNLEH